MTLGVAALVVANRSSISSGGSSLAGADLEWLAFALALTTAVWVAGTAAQLGAVPIRPPLSQLFAVPVAASVINHFVPDSLGGMAVNVRYLQRSGMSRPAALAAVGLNSVASPGGFGALDVTLVAGLVAVGAPTTTAVATVLGYRLLTVWVPLVPGALVFAVLLRRHVL